MFYFFAMKSAAVFLVAAVAGSGVAAHPHKTSDHLSLSPRQALFANLFFKSRGNYTDSTEVIGIPLSIFDPLESAKRLVQIKEPYAKYRVQDDSYVSPDTGITHVHFVGDPLVSCQNPEAKRMILRL